ARERGPILGPRLQESERPIMPANRRVDAGYDDAFVTLGHSCRLGVFGDTSDASLLCAERLSNETRGQLEHLWDIVFGEPSGSQLGEGGLFPCHALQQRARALLLKVPDAEAQDDRFPTQHHSLAGEVVRKRSAVLALQVTLER